MAKVASLGIDCVDVLGRPVSGIPPGQGLSTLEEIRLTVAGTAAGTGVDLAKLGMDVYAIGALGQDDLGEFVIGTMTRYGIHTEGLVRKKGVQTSATMLPIRPNGERPARCTSPARTQSLHSRTSISISSPRWISCTSEGPGNRPSQLAEGSGRGAPVRRLFHARLRGSRHDVRAFESSRRNQVLPGQRRGTHRVQNGRNGKQRGLEGERADPGDSVPCLGRSGRGLHRLR